MNIFLIGSGGREHMIAWKLDRSKKVKNLFVAPGNAGTDEWNVDVDVKDFAKVKEFVLKENIELVVVGPEDPLAAGIVDFFRSDKDLMDINIFGPTQEAAKLESSKLWAKRFMKRHKIPTADFLVFTDKNRDVANKLKTMPLPHVVKADGLYAGKGVVICHTLEESVKTVNAMLKGDFGDAGKTVVVEKFLPGIELSVFAIVDGEKYVLLPEAKDYKKVGDGDTGPNTGGMGAVSPVPFADEEFMQKVKKQIIEPTVNGLSEEGIEYWGIIYFGLMNVDGNPYVVEYNVRMGDPETEVVLSRVLTDLVPFFIAACLGELEPVPISVDERFYVTIILASIGYPGNYEKGKVIKGLDQGNGDSIKIIHCGTKKMPNGDVVTNGGRVLAIVACGETLEIAQRRCLDTAQRIYFSGMYYRRDIGNDVIKIMEKRRLLVLNSGSGSGV